MPHTQAFAPGFVFFKWVRNIAFLVPSIPHACMVASKRKKDSEEEENKV